MYRHGNRQHRRASWRPTVAAIALLTAAAVAVGPMPAAYADSGVGNLCVTVSNVRNGLGHIRLAVCTSQTFLGANCPFQASAPAQVGSVTVCMDGVAPGTYAVQAFHDEDDSGRFKRSFLGIPEEGFGFSNIASVRFSAPRFADAAFRLTPDGSKVHLSLQHFN